MTANPKYTCWTVWPVLGNQRLQGQLHKKCTGAVCLALASCSQGAKMIENQLNSSLEPSHSNCRNTVKESPSA